MFVAVGCVVLQGITTLSPCRAFTLDHDPIITHIQVIAPQHGRHMPGPIAWEM